MRYRLTIGYDGAAFAGWQRQKNAPTVQGTLEAAFPRFCLHPVAVHGSGRTDAGVHAAGQEAHVDLIKTWTPYRLMSAANAHLRDHAIKILCVTPVDDDFHARFSARQRHYTYRVINRPSPPVFLRHHAWHVPETLDLDAMMTAGQFLLGTHDFSSFRAAGCTASSPKRTLDRLIVRRENAGNNDKNNTENHIASHDENRSVVSFSFSARSFLYRQVRLTVGALIAIGKGRQPPQAMADILAKRDHARAGPTAPPQGLCLTLVEY